MQNFIKIGQVVPEILPLEVELSSAENPELAQWDPAAIAALPRPSPWAHLDQTWYTPSKHPPPPRETHRREKFSPFCSTINRLGDTAIFSHF